MLALLSVHSNWVVGSVCATEVHCRSSDSFPFLYRLARGSAPFASASWGLAVSLMVIVWCIESNLWLALIRSPIVLHTGQHVLFPTRVVVMLVSRERNYMAWLIMMPCKPRVSAAFYFLSKKKKKIILRAKHADVWTTFRKLLLYALGHKQVGGVGMLCVTKQLAVKTI